uniref:HDC18592 n=1 Tax=Drosophila melanogaster TaxID=7227 RepID=Q6IIE1_DROME|nr:TPA_inf: HDC18592 [Drosophila melanogaster]
MMQQRISGFWQGQLPVYRLKFLITLSLELISSNKRSCQIHVPLPDSKYIQFATRARLEHNSFRKNTNFKKHTKFIVKRRKFIG